MRSARSGNSLMAKIPRFGARHEAVVQGQLVGQVPALGDLDRVDLADQVGDRRVGRGQLLAEAVVAVHPRDRRRVTVLGHQIAGVLRHRRVRIVVDLAPGDDRHPLVEQVGERADDPRLGLTPLAEEDHVVAGEQRVLELRHHGVLVADDTLEHRFPGGDLGDRVRADLLLHRTRHPARRLQVPECGCTSSHRVEPTLRPPPITRAYRAHPPHPSSMS